MKKAIILFLILGTLISCDDSDDNYTLTNSIIGNWTLTEMTTYFPTDTTNGADMPWQESYQFDSNGTFIKMRDTDGDVTEGSGTYSIYSLDESQIELTFDSTSDIVASCSSQIQEYLLIRDNNILKGNWDACDGPSLTYKKD